MEPCIFVKTLKNCPHDNPFSVSKAVGKSCYVSCSVLKICQALLDNSGMFSVGIYLQCIVKERYFSYDLLETKQKQNYKYLYTYVHTCYIYKNIFVLKEDEIIYLFEKVCLHFNCCGNILKFCMS